MNELEPKIPSTLRRDAADEPLAPEPNLADEVLATFRGRHRWLAIAVTVLSLAAFAGFVLAAIRFCGATETTAQLRWGGLAAALLLVISLFKVWFWLDMQTNRVLLEMKRLELLLATRPRE